MKLLKSLMFILLISCKTTAPVSKTREVVDNSYLAVLEKTLKSLDGQLNYIEYEHANNICFLQKDICDLKQIQICTKSYSLILKNARIKKCLEVQEKICFKKHEDCIISNYRRWESIKKAKGF